MADSKQALTAVKSRLGAFAKASPGVMKGVAEINRAATAPGQFDAAQKELMAVAISVAKGCEDCILYHLDAASGMAPARRLLSRRSRSRSRWAAVRR
ncbi:carboxymuconolactone decarboxylase family protein [Nordella sp. HKS 07]|uniref:carboxymuconolactone decarboxylase family protein n=1 Tax=Nordella sp. HKS 07 TaxID=2712222 RepID=UPI001FEF44F4|nr:carboxymuconolactone decarboxylase family protein [Nordella sp. HKS 07]